MIDAIKAVLSDKGEMTCLQLVSATGISAQLLIKALRKAVARSELKERNGYYDIIRSKSPVAARRSFGWIEGTEIPRSVMYPLPGHGQLKRCLFWLSLMTKADAGLATI